MGNAQCLPIEIGKVLGDKQDFRIKGTSETFEKDVQCGLLLPPTPKDLLRQTATFSTKIVQVGSRPVCRNMSSGTDYESVHKVVPVITRPPTAQYENIYDNQGPKFPLPEPVRPHTSPTAQDFDPGKCIYSTRPTRIASFDYPYRPTGIPATWPNQTRINASGDIWQKPANVGFFETPSKTLQQDIRIIGQPDIIQQPLIFQSPQIGFLRKAKSWQSLPDKVVENTALDHYTSRAVSMDAIHIPSAITENPQINAAPFAQSCVNFYESPYQNVPRSALKPFAFTNSNQSNIDYTNLNRPHCRCCAYRRIIVEPHKPTAAQSMSNFGESGTQLVRASSMRAFKTGMTEGERRRLLRFADVNKSGFEVYTPAASPPGPVGDALSPDWVKEKTKNSVHRQKSVSFGQPSHFRFYLKESPQVNKILMDQRDRRIRAICDRFQCDLEVYSKVPKSGFMQYAIDITAPDGTSLYACSRNLDLTLGWFLTSQIKASKILKP